MPPYHLIQGHKRIVKQVKKHKKQLTADHRDNQLWYMGKSTLVYQKPVSKLVNQWHGIEYSYSCFQTDTELTPPRMT